MTFEVRDLRCVTAAAEHLSLRKAADALAIQPATLNRGIRRLEQALGSEMFERQRSGVRLTAEGEVFLRGARRVLEEFDTLAALLKSHRTPEGRLSIGFHTSLSAGNLRATVLERLLQSQDVEITIMRGSRRQLLADIRTGRLDVAIVVPGDEDWPEAMLPLWSERIVAILPKEHVLAACEIVSWEDLKSETFLFTREDPGPILLGMATGFSAPVGPPGKVKQYDVDSRHIQSLVGAGAGVSITFESSVGEQHPGVVYRQLHRSGDVLRASFAAFWRSDSVNPALARLLDGLRERYPEIDNARLA